MFTKIKRALAKRWLKSDLELHSLMMKRLYGVIERNSIDTVGVIMGLNYIVADQKAQITTLNEALVIAVDRLELISEKETRVANGTVRKMAALASETAMELEELVTRTNPKNGKLPA